MCDIADIYQTYETTLVYVWYISKICLTYEFRVIPGICLVYLRVIFSESPWFMSGIYPTYDFECQSTCSSNAIGMPRRLHTYFGCQGCLLFSAKGGLQPPGAATPERPQMQPNVLSITGMTNLYGFNVVAAATTEKYHDDVHIELAQCLVRK